MASKQELLKRVIKKIKSLDYDQLYQIETKLSDMGYDEE